MHFIGLEDPYETAIVKLIFDMIRKEPSTRMEINQISTYLAGAIKCDVLL